LTIIYRFIVQRIVFKINERAARIDRHSLMRAAESYVRSARRCLGEKTAVTEMRAVRRVSHREHSRFPTLGKQFIIVRNVAEIIGRRIKNRRHGLRFQTVFEKIRDVFKSHGCNSEQLATAVKTLVHTADTADCSALFRYRQRDVHADRTALRHEKRMSAASGFSRFFLCLEYDTRRACEIVEPFHFGIVESA